MKHIKIKLVILLLATATFFTSMSLKVMAENTAEEIMLQSCITSGTWDGQSLLEWSYDSDTKTLTLTGFASDFTGPYDSRLGSLISPLRSKFADVKHIVFTDCRLSGTVSGLFAHLYSLESIDFTGLNTSYVDRMSSMFYKCYNLTELDLTNFDTSSVDLLSGMFYGCSKLTSVNLSNFDTSSVSDMSEMFYGCKALSAVDLSGFKLKKVSSMEKMFYECSSLTSIVLSDTESSYGMLKDAGYMFYKCSSLNEATLYFPESMYLETTELMFYGCSSLKNLEHNIKGSAYFISMRSMFNGCSSLKSIDLSNASFSGAQNISFLFSGCTSLTNLDMSGLELGNIKTYNDMFNNCTSLKIFKTPSIFRGVSPLASLYKEYNEETGELSDNIVTTLSTSYKNTTLKALEPEQPIVTTRSTTEGKNVIKWKGTSDANGYIVMRRASKNGEWEEIADIADLTSLRYEDSDVVSRTRYYYTVKAYIEINGIRAYSAYENDTKGVKTSIATVTLEGVESVDGINTLTWKPLDNVAGYVIKRKTEGGKWITVGVVSGADRSSFNDKKALTPGKKYIYTVFAMGYKLDATDNYSKYGSFDKNGLAVTVSLKPVALKGISSVSGCITVSWKKLNGVAGYLVCRRESVLGGSAWDRLGFVENGSKSTYKYADTTGMAYTTYIYAVLPYYLDDEGEMVFGESFDTISAVAK